MKYLDDLGANPFSAPAPGDSDSAEAVWVTARQPQWTMYHGTSSEFLQAILKTGLLPDPGHRVWKDDPEASLDIVSRETYGGVYFATDLAVAVSAAKWATSRFGGNSLIVVAQIQPRTALPDEDAIVEIVESNLDSMIRIYWPLGRSGVVKAVEYIAPAWAAMMIAEEQFSAGVDAEARARCRAKWKLITDEFSKVLKLRGVFSRNPAFDDAAAAALVASMERKAAYSVGTDEEWRRALLATDLAPAVRSGHRIRKPDRAATERQLRAALQRLMDVGGKQHLHQRRGDEEVDTSLRVLTPVGFRGANRITGVIEVGEFGLAILHYGEATDEIRRRYRSVVTPDQYRKIVEKKTAAPGPTPVTAEKKRLTKQTVMGWRRYFLTLLNPKIDQTDDRQAFADAERAVGAIQKFLDDLDFQVRTNLAVFMDAAQKRRYGWLVGWLREHLSDLPKRIEHWRNVQQKDASQFPGGVIPDYWRDSGDQMLALYRKNFSESLQIFDPNAFRDHPDAKGPERRRMGKGTTVPLLAGFDKLFETLRQEAARYDREDFEGVEPVVRQFDLHGLKVLIHDPGETRGRGGAYAFVRGLDKCYQLMRRRGVDRVWGGNLEVLPEGLAPPNRLGGDFGTDATYNYATDVIRWYREKYIRADDITYVLAHELGHRYWFKGMSQADRLRFREWFEQQEIQPVSRYGAAHFEEAFAEVFAHYVTGEDMTRDQLDSFKAMLLDRDRVTRAEVRAATTPLPRSFDRTEVGLLTREEFLRQRNPTVKFHDSSAYDFDLASLNRDLYEVATAGYGDGRFALLVNEDWKTAKNFVISRGGAVVAVLHAGVLYCEKQFNERLLARPFRTGRGGEEIHLNIDRVERVKYPVEKVGLVSDVARKNLEQYPKLIQNLQVGGEAMQLRAERAPEKNKGTSLAVLNAEGLRVGVAQDEWGATLVSVAREYRGKGLGEALGREWYRHNPSYKSGGFTPAGQENALRMWEARVREFLENGWYSELVKTGRIAKEKVDRILADLGPRREKRAKPPAEPKAKSDIRVFAQDSTFVVYDSKFLSDPDEKYIHGFGFFRDDSRVGTFLYRIEHDRPYAELTTRVALQMARDDDDRVYIGEGYGDIIEWAGVEGIRQDGDYLEVTRDVYPLSREAARERRLREAVDRYSELYYQLLETAEAKWA